MLSTTLYEVVREDGGATPPKRGREALLRPEYAALYPGLRVGTWEPAAIVADRWLAHCLLQGRETALWGRVLLDEHFEFRGGAFQGGEREGVRPRREPQ